MEKEIVEKECYSADHFETTEKKSANELVEIMDTIRDKVFTVAFKKQRTEKEVIEILKGMEKTLIGDEKKLKKFCKKLIEGESTTMVCNLLTKEHVMGRSMVRKLDKNNANNIR